MCICKMPFSDTYLNVLDLCRLCLASDDNLIPVFDSCLISDQLPDKINVCLAIQIKTEDQVSQKICNGCLTKINSFYDFRSQTTESQKVLQSWLKSNVENQLAVHLVDITETCTEEKVCEVIQNSETGTVKEITDRLKTELSSSDESDSSETDNDSGSNCDSSDLDTEESGESDNSKEHKSLDTLNTSERVSDNASVENGTPGPSSTNDENEQSSIKLQEPINNVHESVNGGINGKTLLETDETPDADRGDNENNICENLYPAILTIRGKEADHSLVSSFNENKFNQSGKSPKKKFECNICQFTAKYKSQLDIHIKRHQKDYKVFCDVCHKGFFYQNEIEMHKALHEETNRFECTVCQKKFVYRHSLVSHSRKHSNLPKPRLSFQCDKCGKEFSDKYYLKRHKDLHSGVNKVICEVCGQLLSNPGALRSHRLTHTGERPFECSTCGKSFTTKKYMAIHKRTHTGTKPFTCQTCGKSFSQQSTLIVHRRYHSGERPYQCQMCDKAFVTKTILKIHQKNHSI